MALFCNSPQNGEGQGPNSNLKGHGSNWNWSSDPGYYKALSGHLAKRDEEVAEKPQIQVIDLRIPNLAFISMEN